MISIFHRSCDFNHHSEEKLDAMNADVNGFVREVALIDFCFNLMEPKV